MQQASKPVCEQAGRYPVFGTVGIPSGVGWEA